MTEVSPTAKRAGDPTEVLRLLLVCTQGGAAVAGYVSCVMGEPWPCRLSCGNGAVCVCVWLRCGACVCMCVVAACRIGTSCFDSMEDKRRAP